MNDFAPGLRRDDEGEQHRTELRRAELVASERRAGELRALAAKTTFASLLAPAPATPTSRTGATSPVATANGPRASERTALDRSNLLSRVDREGKDHERESVAADRQDDRSSERRLVDRESRLPTTGALPQPEPTPSPTPSPALAPAGPALKATEVAAVRAAADGQSAAERPSLAFALDRGAMAGMELVVVALGGGDVGLRLAGKPPPRKDLQKAVAELVAQLEAAGVSVREVGFHTMGRPQRRGP